MDIPDSFPQLAVGSHGAGSGKACIMNAVSYINGDTLITDMPDCAYPLLARFATRINDKICVHRTNTLLCPECSHSMWLLGARIIGTADAVKGWTGEQLDVLDARLTVRAVRSVMHLVQSEARAVCERAIAAAEAWADFPTAENRMAARTAFYAVNGFNTYNVPVSAVFATYAVGFAVSATVGSSAHAVSDAVGAVNAVYTAIDASSTDGLAVAASFLNVVHAVIDEFQRLTGCGTTTHEWTATEIATVRDKACLTT